MRTATGVIIGAALAWCALAIWRGPTWWFFYHLPPATHPDCHTRIRVWHLSVEQEDASCPE